MFKIIKNTFWSDLILKVQNNFTNFFVFRRIRVCRRLVYEIVQVTLELVFSFRFWSKFSAMQLFCLSGCIHLCSSVVWIAFHKRNVQRPTVCEHLECCSVIFKEAEKLKKKFFRLLCHKVAMTTTTFRHQQLQQDELKTESWYANVCSTTDWINLCLKVPTS